MKAAHPHRPELLIVDDTPENLQLLIGMMDKNVYKVRPVTSGAHALKAARVHPPDLVLLDIMMPEMDGYAVCEQMKADPNLREIPIIFISALSDALDKVKAFKAGGVDYISKPFNFAEVEARIQTHLKLCRQKRELQESRDKLAELEQLRDGLVHMIVHDMKSPLAALGMAVDLLKEAVPPRDMYVEEILRNARLGVNSLLEMTNQMLDLSRLESGAMSLVLEPGNLSETVRSACALFSLLDSNHRLEVQVNGVLPASYDAAVIQRVVGNLVGNALKYTPETGGRVCIDAFRDGDSVRISVADNGPGIPQEFISKVFEKFVRVPGSRKIQGTGLGLTFCKMAIEAHGGRIGVESIEGKGSTFWFLLPATEGP